ncbi:alpha/beta fold hydrolase [Streptomyces bottropensis]|uniref:alpha/beta fold hydrolase n=1 Tax=Streptomyces bottropensis TaxID=42235 RepID=UPI00369A0390
MIGARRFLGAVRACGGARDEVRLVCRDRGGPGEPVVLLHGLADHAGEWEVATRLIARYRVVAVDQRGHGASKRHRRGSARSAVHRLLPDDCMDSVRERRSGAGPPPCTERADPAPSESKSARERALPVRHSSEAGFAVQSRASRRLRHCAGVIDFPLSVIRSVGSGLTFQPTEARPAVEGSLNSSFDRPGRLLPSNDGPIYKRSCTLVYSS